MNKFLYIPVLMSALTHPRPPNFITQPGLRQLLRPGWGHRTVRFHDFTNELSTQSQHLFGLLIHYDLRRLILYPVLLATRHFIDLFW
jgi:hypothetical protein